MLPSHSSTRAEGAINHVFGTGVRHNFLVGLGVSYSSIPTPFGHTCALWMTIVAVPESYETVYALAGARPERIDF